MQRGQTRQPYQQQPCHTIIVDDSSTLNSHVLQNFTQCILRSVSLAVSIRGVCRVSALSITSLCGRPRVCFPMKQPRGHMDQLRTSIVKLLDSVRLQGSEADSEHRGGADERVASLLDECLHQFNMQQQDRSFRQMDITILTSDSLMVESLKHWLDGLAQTSAEKIQHIQMFLVVAVMDMIEGEHRMAELTKSVPLHVWKCYGEQDCFADHFQSWLLDQPGEVEQLRLLLPPFEAPLTLKCDLRSCHVSPLLLPFTHRLVLSTEPVGWHAGTKGDLPVHELEVTGRLNRSQLCQSAIFGDPIVVKHTECWSLEWQALQTNRQCLLALIAELRATDDVLTARLRPQSQTVSVSGIFSISPAGTGDQLLMTSLVPSELLLPSGGDSRRMERVPQKIEQQVAASLSAVECLENYNPRRHQCGLYRALDSLTQRSSGRQQHKTTTPQQQAVDTEDNTTRTAQTRTARGRSLRCTSRTHINAPH